MARIIAGWSWCCDGVMIRMSWCTGLQLGGGVVVVMVDDGHDYIIIM